MTVPGPPVSPQLSPRAARCQALRGLVLLWLVVGSGLITGCDSGDQELQAWMEQQRREVRPRVQPLAAPKKFDPVPYANAQQIDPFSSQKLTVAIKQESRQPSSLLAAEMNRRKEPLEAFSLDMMAMVGSVSQAGVPFALLKVDNLLYRVKPGDYVGQNFGRVARITETEVVLREIVQDSAGEWIERSASLQLQERGQERAR